VADGAGDEPRGAASLRGILHVSHGMAEHAGRYARLAESLTAAGWAVYANDHRGHGKTVRWESELGFFAGEGGFQRVVRDLEQLVEHEKKQHPGVPLVLFGHSMGSYFVQEFLITRGSSLQGAVLSGSSGKPNALASAGRLVARAERVRLGERGRSELLNALSFESFNKVFAPNRTAFDWLSRDEAEVDKYIADDRCGFMVTTSLWVDVLDGVAEMSRPERQAWVPRDVPIYIFAGSRDPVGADTKSLVQLLGAYRAAGLRNVKHRFYPGGRHEMINETNRDEVTRDLLAWLAAEVKITASAGPVVAQPTASP
jgi:alpha-beta hydrolase superfamily lysophospholipase